MANTQFGAKEVMNVTLFKYDTASLKYLPFIYFDSLKTSSISVSSEKVYARGGRGNPKLRTWEINKEATLTIEDALISPKSLELVTSMAATHNITESLFIRETITTSSAGAATLNHEYKASGVLHIYAAADDCGSDVKAQFTVSGKNVSTTTTANRGKSFVVYYESATTNNDDVYQITSDKFAGTYKLVGDTVLRNASTGLDEPFQIIIPQLKWTSDLELGFAAEGDPATTSFECEIQKPADSTTMIEMIKYEDPES